MSGLSDLLELDILMRARSEGMEEFDRVSGQMGMLGKAGAAVVAGVAAAGAAVSAFAVDAISKTEAAGHSAYEMSEMFGLTGQQASQWQAAGQQVGVSSDQMTLGFRTLSRQMETAQQQYQAQLASATNFTDKQSANATKLAQGYEQQQAALDKLNASDQHRQSLAQQTIAQDQARVAAATSQAQYTAAQQKLAKDQENEQYAQTQVAAQQAAIQQKQQAIVTQEGAVALQGFTPKLGAMQDQLKSFGISLVDGNGHMKDMNEVMFEIADAFQKMPDGPDKASMALKLFGRAGTDLIPVLNEGRAGLEQLIGTATAAGDVMSTDQVDAAQKMYLAHKQLDQAIQGLSISLGTMLMPVATQLVTAFTTEVLPAVHEATIWFGDHLTPVLQQLWNEFSTNVTPAAHALGREFDTYLKPMLMDVWDIFVNDLWPAAHDMWDIFENYLLPAGEDIAKWAAGDIQGSLAWIGDHFQLLVTVVGALVALKAVDWAAGVAKSLKDMAGNNIFDTIATKFKSIFLPNISGADTAKQTSQMETQGREDGTAYKRGWNSVAAGIPPGGAGAGLGGKGGAGTTVIEEGGGLATDGTVAASKMSKIASLLPVLGTAGMLGFMAYESGAFDPSSYKAPTNLANAMTDLTDGLMAVAALGTTLKGLWSVVGVLRSLPGLPTTLPKGTPTPSAPKPGPGTELPEVIPEVGAGAAGASTVAGAATAGESLTTMPVGIGGTLGATAPAAAPVAAGAAPEAAAVVGSGGGLLSVGTAIPGVGVIAGVGSMILGPGPQSVAQRQAAGAAAGATAGATTTGEKSLAQQYSDEIAAITGAAPNPYGYSMKDLINATNQWLDTTTKGPQTVAQIGQEYDFVTNLESEFGENPALDTVTAKLLAGSNELQNQAASLQSMPGYGTAWGVAIQNVNGQWETTTYYMTQAAAQAAAAQDYTQNSLGPSKGLADNYRDAQQNGTGPISTDLSGWTGYIMGANGQLQQMSSNLNSIVTTLPALNITPQPKQYGPPVPPPALSTGGAAPPLFPSPTGMTLALATSSEVTSWYNTYLGRNPSDSDIEYWTTQGEDDALTAIQSSPEAQKYKASLGGSLGPGNLRIRTAQTGGYFPAIPGGYVVNVGEGGEDESIIPESKLLPTFAPVINALLSAASSGGDMSDVTTILMDIASHLATLNSMWGNLGSQQLDALHQLVQSNAGNVSVVNARAMAGARVA